MRILFMGTPDFAATALKAIAGSNNNYDIVGVVTRVDMPKNRGQKL
ncbi:MAG: methionyl-tRNA formyltransferase, partial [Clostridia bacterium]|nr:methionyl-tRNA formyltransferase [Clostridia bacterium]